MTNDHSRPSRVGRLHLFATVLAIAAALGCSESPLRPTQNEPSLKIPQPTRLIDVDDEWNQMTLDVEVFASGPTGATANSTRGYHFSVTRQLGSNGVWQSIFNLGSMYPSNAALPTGMSPPTRIETADDKSYLRVYNAAGLMPSISLDTSIHAAPPGLRARPKYATPFPTVAPAGGNILAAASVAPFATPKDSSRAWADAYVVGRNAKARMLSRLLATQGVSRASRDTVDILSMRVGSDSVRVTLNPKTGLVHERATFHAGTSIVKRNTYTRLGADSWVLKESQTERRAADGSLVGPSVTTRYSNVKLALVSPPTT